MIVYSPSIYLNKLEFLSVFATMVLSCIAWVPFLITSESCTSSSLPDRNLSTHMVLWHMMYGVHFTKRLRMKKASTKYSAIPPCSHSQSLNAPRQGKHRWRSDGLISTVSTAQRIIFADNMRNFSGNKNDTPLAHLQQSANED